MAAATGTQALSQVTQAVTVPETLSCGQASGRVSDSPRPRPPPERNVGARPGSGCSELRFDAAPERRLRGRLSRAFPRSAPRPLGEARLGRRAEGAGEGRGTAGRSGRGGVGGGPEEESEHGSCGRRRRPARGRGAPGASDRDGNS